MYTVNALITVMMAQECGWSCCYLKKLWRISQCYVHIECIDYCNVGPGMWMILLLLKKAMTHLTVLCIHWMHWCNVGPGMWMILLLLKKAMTHLTVLCMHWMHYCTVGPGMCMILNIIKKAMTHLTVVCTQWTVMMARGCAWSSTLLKKLWRISQ